MTLNKSKVLAHKKLEEAVSALTTAYREPGDDEATLLSGWILIVGEIKMDNDSEDELDVIDVIGSYSQRGQSPILSLGLVHEWLVHYDQRDPV